MRGGEVFLLLTFWICGGGVEAIRRVPVPRFSGQPILDYTTASFDAYVDNNNPSMGTFTVKYLINTAFFKDNSPLFFYTGNEGTIETFVDNTGIMFDLAPRFNAMIVFCEHRYYGNGSSLPYGNKDFDNINNAQYLSSEQAIADFVVLIGKLRQKHKISKIIAFGGSYGGMLSAWFKAKYPHIIDGAWAASAPVAYFRGSSIPLGGFDQVVGRTMTRFGCDITAVNDAIYNKLKQCTLDDLNRIFNVDPAHKLKTTDDLVYLKGYIREGFEYMAMTNYPYPANFLKDMGAWPMLTACQNLGKKVDDPNTAAAYLKKAMDSYYGTNDKACFMPGCGDEATGNLGDLYGWTFQTCTRIPIDICAQGLPNDPFELECSIDGNGGVPKFEKYFSDTCMDSLSTSIVNYTKNMIQYDFIQNYYGFDLAGTTNLILTQGKLDPWSSGGALIDSATASANNIYMFNIDGAAHHLDLRTPNSCDPPSVISARYQIVRILKCWVGQGGKECDNPQSLQWDLPPFSNPKIQTDCKVLNNQYPWGQSPPDQAATATTAVTSPAPPPTTTGSTNSIQPSSLLIGSFLILWLIQFLNSFAQTPLLSPTT